MKILLLSSIYPIPDDRIIGGTSVCHYFAKEWLKLGHEVIVINTYTIYHKFFHALSKIFTYTLSNYFAASINITRYSTCKEYIIDNVPVLLCPTYKLMPKVRFQTESISELAYNIKKYLTLKNFKPDIIVGHFLHPNIEIIPVLKKMYNDIPCGIVLHGEIVRQDISQIKKSKNYVDFWGFRSYPIHASFEKKVYSPPKYFFCFSGVPETFIQPESYKKHNHIGVTKYIYVGNLMKRKYPRAVLSALINSNLHFHINYIGEGKQRADIIKLANRAKKNGQISLLGQLPRSIVSEKLRDAECFIMISKHETFGLVYLEAMAAGCITIASKHEGMENIIIDGVNGFLCEAGNHKELSSIIGKINNLSANEKQIISKNAIETSKKMTDTNVSSNYICHLKNYCGL